MRNFAAHFLLWAVFLNGLFSEESACFLTNIQQITFPEMGFVKAGEAYFSPDDTHIIFQAVPEGKEHYQIYVMNREEGVPQMISTGRGNCTCGFFHPKGNQVIFASSHSDPTIAAQEDFVPNAKRDKYVWELTPYMNIYSANIDGSDLTPLTHGPAYHAECAFSPDGTKIVFASNQSGTMNLYVMDADGGSLRQITHTNYSYNGGPFFSPDGKQIVFRSDRELAGYLQIFTIAVDGTNEKQHTHNHSVNWAPFWHPDGKNIVFTKSVGSEHRYELFLLHVDTGQEVRLTDNPAFDGLPVFNNQGTKIMWTSKRGQDKTCQIFIADFNLENVN